MLDISESSAQSFSALLVCALPLQTFMRSDLCVILQFQFISSLRPSLYTLCCHEKDAFPQSPNLTGRLLPMVPSIWSQPFNR